VISFLPPLWNVTGDGSLASLTAVKEAIRMRSWNTMFNIIPRFQDDGVVSAGKRTQTCDK
jgi:hypothetical protein